MGYLTTVHETETLRGRGALPACPAGITLNSAGPPPVSSPVDVLPSSVLTLCNRSVTGACIFRPPPHSVEYMVNALQVDDEDDRDASFR